MNFAVLTDIDDFYEIDSEEGKIVNKRQGVRALILSSSVWRQIEDRLYTDFGSGASVILFDMGRSSGAAIANETVWSDLKRSSGRPDPFRIQHLIRNAATSGWGKMTVSGLEGDRFKVNVLKCVFCSGRSEGKDEVSQCYFLKGVITGVAETVYGVPTKVTETHCSKEYCEFDISMKTLGN